MFIYIFWAAVIIFMINQIYNYIEKERNIKNLFSSDEMLKASTIILFSNKDLVRVIRNFLITTKKDIKVECFKEDYLVLRNSDSDDEITEKINHIRKSIIEKKCKEGDKFSIGDYVDNIMLNIWLDYGHEKYYRRLFKKEMYRLLNSGEIADSSFNEMYRRFYKFDRSKIMIGGIV